ncbi:MAG: tubulin-like doman-containing protein [Armatimonadetes bacterium]|nr:tubulin-like doman-containing protein [Armatimonadota bacterium]
MAEEFVREALRAEQEQVGIQPVETAAIRVSDFPPAMFIGLGGTGALMTSYIARRLAAIFAKGRLEDLSPRLQFLIIDTDPSVRNYVRDLPGARIPVLEVSNFHVEQALETRFQEAHEDYPHPYFAGNVTDGAHQARAVGHVAMLWAASEHWAQLQDAFQRFQMNLGDVGPRVYILGSLCGGTGAGMALDMAYLAKAMLQGQALAVVGIFVDPTAFEGQGVGPDVARMAKINTYAFLKELDHFFTHFDYPLKHFDRAELAGLRIEQLERPRPFWVTLLVGTRDARGRRLRYGRDHVCGLVGEFVVTQYLGWQAAQGAGSQDMFSILDNNPPDVLPDGSKAILGSLGLSAYVYPRRQVESYVLHTLGGKVLGRYLDGRGSFDPQAAAAEFMTEANLEEHQQDLLLSQIMAGDNWGEVSKLLADAVQTCMADRLTEVPSVVDGWESEYRKALEAVRQNMEQKATQVLGLAFEKLENWCARQVDVWAGGLRGLARALEELKARIETCRSEMASEADSLRTQLAGCDSDDKNEPGEMQKSKEQIREAALQRTWFGLAGPRRSVVRQAVEAYVDACRAAAGNYRELRARECAQDVFAKLLPRVNSLLAEVGKLSALIADAQHRSEEAAKRALRFGTATGEEGGRFTQHLHYALTPEGVVKLYETWFQGRVDDNKDPVEAATADAHQRSGNLWDWFRWSPEEERYMVADRREELVKCVGEAAFAAFSDLRDKALADLVAPEILAQRAQEMAKDCAELLMTNPALLPQEGGQWHYIVLAMPETGKMWEEVRTAVSQVSDGAQVQAVASMDRDRIVLARWKLGIPVKALREVPAWYELYVQQLAYFEGARKVRGARGVVTVKPPHICRDWENFEDPLVESQRRGAEELLGLALATRLPEGYRVKGSSGAKDRTLVWATPAHIGGWCYLHACPAAPQDREVEAITLGQGIANAVEKLRSDRTARESLEAWFAEDGDHSILRQGYQQVAEQMAAGLATLRTWRDSLARSDPEYEEKSQLLDRMIRAVERYIREKLGGQVS